MKVAAYIHPTRIGAHATGVGKHIAHMTAELGRQKGIDLTLVATARDWDSYVKRDPTSPLIDFNVHRIGVRRALLEKVWSIGRTPPVERWVGAVDWVYCPMEAFVPTRHARLAVTSHAMHWFDKSLKELYEKSRLERLRWRVRIGAALRDERVVWLAVSQFLKGELIKLFGIDEARIAVTGNGVEPEFFNVKSNVDVGRDGPYLLSVGGLQYWKGGDRLLRVAKRLNDLKSDLMIIIVGRHEEALTKIARSLPNITLGEYVGSKTGLPELVAGAVALLNLTRYDTFGIPVAEAMAAGTAVVASNNSAMPEVVGNAGILVEPDDTDTVCDIAARLLTDTSFRRSLGEKARIAARQYTWSSCCDRLVAALSSMN